MAFKIEDGDPIDTIHVPYTKYTGIINYYAGLQNDSNNNYVGELSNKNVIPICSEYDDTEELEPVDWCTAQLNTIEETNTARQISITLDVNNTDYNRTCYLYLKYGNAVSKGYIEIEQDEQPQYVQMKYISNTFRNSNILMSIESDDVLTSLSYFNDYKNIGSSVSNGCVSVSGTVTFPMLDSYYNGSSGTARIQLKYKGLTQSKIYNFSSCDIEEYDLDTGSWIKIGQMDAYDTYFEITSYKNNELLTHSTGDIVFNMSGRVAFGGYIINISFSFNYG